MKKTLLTSIVALFLTTEAAHAVDCRVDNTPFCNCLRRTVIGLRGTALHKRMEKARGPYAPMTKTLLGACWRQYGGE
jgi:hypothetical protein